MKTVQTNKGTKPHKQTKSKTDTIEFDDKIADSWLAPPFQRPLKVNHKVEELAKTIYEDGGVVPGTITLGVLDGDTYLLDGQHRIQAWRMSGVQTGYCDVRLLHLDSMGEMGEEFVALNSALVRFSPDDILRGLQESSPLLREIVRRCPFVGYDFIRRRTSGPVVSMSMILRSWEGSATEVPAMTNSAALIITGGRIDEESGKALCNFLELAYQAWGRDEQHHRLWGVTNLIVCMWLYRRIVMTKAGPRVQQLSPVDFKRCMMALSADSDYLDWLVGRHSPTRDRSACYTRLKRIFVARLKADKGGSPVLPSPAWAAR